MVTGSKMVSELMQHGVIEIDPEARVGAVLELAREKGAHHFPLVRGGSLVGLVCTCDLDEAPLQAQVSGVARRDVVTVARESRLRDAARMMLKKAVGSVVVMRGTHVCGLLTREDLVRDDPEWAPLFAAQRCSACGAEKHLRTWSRGVLLCSSCASRARDGGALDLGDGD